MQKKCADKQQNQEVPPLSRGRDMPQPAPVDDKAFARRAGEIIGNSNTSKGRAAIEALWKSMAEQVSDPKLTILDVKPLGSSAAREIGTFSLKTKGSMPKEVTGKYLVVWEKIGSDWKLAADIWNDRK
jgi:hypothetical protein